MIMGHLYFLFYVFFLYFPHVYHNFCNFYNQKISKGEDKWAHIRMWPFFGQIAKLVLDVQPSLYKNANILFLWVFNILQLEMVPLLSRIVDSQLEEEKYPQKAKDTVLSSIT